MSDPPKKPGSLRDRIAAFEHKGAASTPPPAPALRPKPAGGVAWKPRPRSPPPADEAHGSDKSGGMSAADAKASIGQGVSLKERMAALQNLHAFGGGPSPPPKPATEKPKWKTPPAVAAPPAEESEETEHHKSAATEVSDDAQEQQPTAPEEGEPVAGSETAEAEPDPEEEERQRRAAIAARMARLGGARVGMAPPVFRRKPEVNKPETSKEEEHEDKSQESEEPVVSPPTATSTSEQSEDATTDFSEGKDPALLLPEPTTAASTRSASMPVPVVPRRAAPPRKRAAKSPSPGPTKVLQDKVLEGSPSSTPGIPAVPESATSAEAVSPHGGRESALHESQRERLSESVEAPVTANEEETTTTSPRVPAEPSEAPSAEEALAHIAGGEEELSSRIAAEPVDAPAHTPSDEAEILSVAAEVPVPIAEVEEVTASEEQAEVVAAPKPLAQPEEDEDEASRRKRIAERLAKMGGVNPLASTPIHAPVSPAFDPAESATIERRQSLRRDSYDVAPTSSQSPAHDKPAVLRRESTDSQVHHATDAPKSPPMQQTSPKLNALGRKGSVGSVRSSTSIEPPARRASQDAHLSIASPTQNFGEEAHYVTRMSHGNTTDEEVGPHEPHEAVHELQQVTEEEERATDSDYERGYEDQETQLTSETPSSIQVVDAAAGGEADTSQHEYIDIDSPVEASPPPIARAPPPSHSAPSKRQSSVPPPRALPQPPEEEYTESAQGRPPPVRKDTRPSSSHAEVVEAQALSTSYKYGPPSSRPVTYLEVEEPEQLIETFDHDVDDYEGEGFQGENVQPEYEEEVKDFAGDDVAIKTAVASQGTEEAEEEEAPPPPPPRRISVPPPVPVHTQPERRGSVREPEYAHPAQLSPPPPPPPELKPQPLSRPPVPHIPAPVQHVSQAPPSKVVAPPLSRLLTSEREVLHESDGDPIDPTFHSPRKSPTVTATSPLPPPPAPVLPSETTEAPEDELIVPQSSDEQEDPEQARRRTIAERMAKLGGIRFGAPMSPPVRRPQPPPPPAEGHAEDVSAPEQEHEAEDVPAAEQEREAEEAPEEQEDEFARRQRIAARIAGMGGMRFGMLPGAVPPAQPVQPPAAHEQADEPPVVKSTHPPQRSAPVPPPAPALQPPENVPDEGEQIEQEESEAEEISHDEVQDEQPPPPVPPREGRHASTGRPPVPQITRPPVPHAPAPVASPRAERSSAVLEPTSPHTTFSYPPPPSRLPPPPTSDSQGEYVIVEGEDELPPPPPPPRTVSLKKPSPQAAPPHPPSAPAESSEVQWVIPSIPSVDFGGTTDLSLSAQWSEDSTNYPPPPPPSKAEPSGSPSQPPAQSPSRPRSESHLTADDLMAQWGRVGVQIVEHATTLFEKSKKSLVGDGSYIGFVTNVLSQVPNAAQPEPPFTSFGYLIYAQNGSSVQRRVSEIMPGDVIVLREAKFKGHKGLQIYHQTVGAGEPLYAIIADYEMKKAKVKVFQANQHVGQQTVESASYRLEDLKSGSIQIFRVLET
ncbi:uncharacterized protein LAESUDRAFT_722922, partial [Laetiporus sulphureus 93-53]